VHLGVLDDLLQETQAIPHLASRLPAIQGQAALGRPVRTRGRAASLRAQ
jgi:hypothetical protein